MKVGDLVELSAYGTKRQYNHWLKPQSPSECVLGIIVDVSSLNLRYPYRILWQGTEYRTQYRNPSFSRRELKHANR